MGPYAELFLDEKTSLFISFLLFCENDDGLSVKYSKNQENY